MSDVTVMGLVMGTHLIADIGMDVPHGVSITIPGELAVRSRDLWLGISQKKLFRLGAGARPSGPGRPPPPKVTEAEALLARNKLLEAEVETLKGALGEQGSKLDAILAALAARPQVINTTVIQGGPQTPVRANPDVVGGEAPTFIPSEIKPKNAEVRAEVKTAEAEGAGVSDAGAKLRQLRKKRTSDA